jgi:ABC-2 type transport system ATP-binding protein
MSLLEVSNLRKSYDGTLAVNDLSFHVDAGEIFGLLGPNGAGKTTTMMMLAGLRRPDSGEYSLNGRSARDADPQFRTLMGIAPQDLAIYPDLTARENLQFFGRIYGLRGRELAERIDLILKRIELIDTAHQYARTFSGGMKRRLNFGVALLHKPRLVILDEPTVGVDPQSRSHLIESIRQLADDGVGVIYASHYMEEVEAICRRVAIIDHGRLLKCGTLDELLDRSGANVRLRISGVDQRLEAALSATGKIDRISPTEAIIEIVRSKQEPAAALNTRIAQVLETISRLGGSLASIETCEHNLERLFLELTGRSLRD